MSPQFYHLLHLAGVIMLFMGYGALLGRSLAGSDDVRVRRMGSITSGVGLLLMLVAGFGLLAKLYGNTFHGWVIAKIVIWLALGGLIVVINRKPSAALLLWWVTLALGLLGVIFVYYKPF